MEDVLNLYAQIIDPINLEKAWQDISQKSSAAGIDSVTAKDYESNLNNNLAALHDELKKHIAKKIDKNLKTKITPV